MTDESIFHLAQEKPTPVERCAFLDEACAGDPELRRRIERLLAAADQTSGILERGPELAVTVTPGAEASPKPDRLFAGRFKLRERLGEGGMGEVWVADQLEPVQRRVALKVVRLGMDTSRLLARFEQERQALAVMDHPNIAKVFDAGVDEAGRPYFVMELIKGVAITDYCDAEKLSPRQRIELFIPVCHAVQHAHQKGIIHRDLKPSNILVGMYDDRAIPKVIDFGVAKATGPRLSEESIYTEIGSLIGTLEYMSPEQAEPNNIDIDTRSDIYSLGAVLYELLTGSVPISRKELQSAAFVDMLRIIKEVEPPKPSTKLSGSGTLPAVAAARRTEPHKLVGLMRGDLDWIVVKCLEKSRVRRYETANGLAMDLQRYLANEPVSAAAPSAGYRLRKFARRNKGPALAATSTLLLLIAGIIGTSLGLVRAERARSDAVRAQREEAEQRQLAQVNEKKAITEKQIANTVRVFLQSYLLRQSDPWAQANTLRRFGGEFEAKENPTIKELLDRAAAELTPEKIELRFPDQREVQAAILATVGDSYFAIGDFGRAVEFLERAVDLNREIVGADHPDTLICRYNLAKAYQGLGKLPLAIDMFTQVRDASVREFGAKDPRTLTAQNGLALANRVAGNTTEAIALGEQVRDACKQELGANHPDTLATMHNLALAYLDARRISEAIDLLEFVRDERVKQLGAEDPSTLTSCSCLAGAYREAGRTSDAIALCEPTWHAQARLLGAENHYARTTLHNLAEAYKDSGQLGRAVPLYQETLARQSLRLQSDDPEVLITTSGLASAYQAAGQLSKALPLFESILAKWKEKRGSDDPQTLQSMDDLAGAYKAGTRADKALPLYKETFRIRKLHLGPDNPDTLASMSKLAVTYWQMKKLDQSIPLLEDALKASRRIHGEDHQETVKTIANLGVNYRDAGRVKEAIPLLEEAYNRGRPYRSLDWIRFQLLETYVRSGKKAQLISLINERLNSARQREPADGLQLSAALSDAAYWLLRVNAASEAQTLLRECLTICEQKAPDDWSTAHVKSMLGDSLACQQKFDEGEALLLEGYEGMRNREASIPPDSKFRLADGLDRLVKLYEAWGKKNEADKWRSRRPAKPPASVRGDAKKNEIE